MSAQLVFGGLLAVVLYGLTQFVTVQLRRRRR